MLIVGAAVCRRGIILTPKCAVCHSNITDAGIMTVAVHCNQLESLAVEECYNVTIVGLHAARLACGTLQHIDSSGCGQSPTGHEPVVDMYHDPTNVQHLFCTLTSEIT